MDESRGRGRKEGGQRASQLQKVSNCFVMTLE